LIDPTLPPFRVKRLLVGNLLTAVDKVLDAAKQAAKAVA